MEILAGILTGYLHSSGTVEIQFTTNGGVSFPEILARNLDGAEDDFNGTTG